MEGILIGKIELCLNCFQKKQGNGRDRKKWQKSFAEKQVQGNYGEAPSETGMGVQPMLCSGIKMF